VGSEWEMAETGGVTLREMEETAQLNGCGDELIYAGIVVSLEFR
jgi:hypothetical protein